MALPQVCPLCRAGADNQHVVTRHVYGAEQQGRAFFHCATCDVRYMHPGLTREQQHRFYAAEFGRFMAGRSGERAGWMQPGDHVRANEPTRVRRMNYLAPHLKTASNVLEVGCSSGFMLFPLIEAGHRCSGVEPSGVFGEYLRGRGLTVYQDVADIPAEIGVFDLVMHFFVLEHISDPLPFLQLLVSLLSKNGTLVFEVPNAADALYSIYDIPAFERFYWSIAHPWYFSERSLSYLLAALGHPYRIELDQRYDLSNHMVWARDGRPGGMGRFTKEFGQDMEELYKRELVRARKCDTLIGFVTKA